jgi:RNA-directed DNA polymerase
VNKGTHKAVNRFRDFHRKASKNNTKTCWVLKCDIRKFFANIDHSILKEILAKHIKDQDIFWLLGQVIDSFPTSRTCGNKGLPLGNLTSQLLVNVYMNEFDQFVKHELKVKYYIRYADDFVILQNNRIELEKLLGKMKEFLENRLKLSLHPDKVFIKTFASGVDFLGWVHFPHHRILRRATKRKMLWKLAHSPSPETIASYEGMMQWGNTWKIRKYFINP